MLASNRAGIGDGRRHLAWPRSRAAAEAHLVVRVLVDLLAGAALVATLLLPWTRGGSGSLLTGDQLAGLLADQGEVAAAAGIYGAALVGCVVLLTCWWQPGWARLGRALLAVSTGTVLLGVAAAGTLPPGNWGPSPLLVLAASLAVLVAELPGSRASRKRRA